MFLARGSGRGCPQDRCGALGRNDPTRRGLGRAEAFRLGHFLICSQLPVALGGGIRYPAKERGKGYYGKHWNGMGIFDLGKGSIGEAVRLGDKFLHKASLLIPADFVENKNGADRLREAPYGSHRSYLAAKAAWLFPTIDTARLVLIRRKTSNAPQ